MESGITLVTGYHTEHVTAIAGFLYALVLALSVTVLYGSTFQPFRGFNLAAPGGAVDERRRLFAGCAQKRNRRLTFTTTARFLSVGTPEPSVSCSSV